MAMNIEGECKNHVVLVLWTFSYLIATLFSEWQHDKREGLGVVKIGNGDVFEGQFEGNLKNGIGVYHYKDGECDLSLYAHDQRIGDCVRYSRDRKRAFLLGNGGSKGISLEEASTVAKNMGTIVAF